METDEPSLFAVLNSQMRRIDLLCKLLGPLAISLLDGLSTRIAILATLGLSVVSVGIEYLAIAQVIRHRQAVRLFANIVAPTQVYYRVPALHFPGKEGTREGAESQDSIVATDQAQSDSEARSRRNSSNFILYFRHRDILPSMALSLLYLTVLSFAGQMVTYLLSVGYNSTQIGIIRTFSVAVEVSATWLGPILMMRVGVIRAGLWSISWQIFCIATAVALFLVVQQPFIPASGLIAGVIGSRLGLWVFDLCVQTIVQEVCVSDSDMF